MASGTGTLLQALIEAAEESDYSARIVGFATDRRECAAARRALRAQIPVSVVDPGDFSAREDWNTALADAVSGYHPEWVVCLGFMRLVSPHFLNRFAGRVINTHPSLLPAFPGTHAVSDALRYGVHVTGCTVHLVDEGVDSGPILAQVPVGVAPGDTVDSLHDRIKTAERQLIVDLVDRVTLNGYTISGRKALLS